MTYRESDSYTRGHPQHSEWADVSTEDYDERQDSE